MKGGTLFSGIGTPELAAPWVDWRWFAEIDPFASAVHAVRFPNVPNLGDVRKFPDAVEPVELIVFGSPCQSFSIAGKRAGLDDPRGNMAIIGLQIVDRVRPDWVVFENVPGLLSSDEWRDFGTFLGALGECGYGFAYRVLNAQYFGVPQRRRRVFVVGYFGDWRPPAAVLFERECLSWNSPPSREERQGIARPIGSCIEGGSGYRSDVDTADNLIARALTSRTGGSGRTERDGGDTLVTFHATQDLIFLDNNALPLEARGGYQAVTYGGNNTSGSIEIATACNAHSSPYGRIDFESETFVMLNPTGADTIAFDTTQITHPENRSNPQHGDPCHQLNASAHAPTIAFTERTRADGRNLEAQDDLAYALCNPGSGGRTHSRNLLDASMAVRRLTPRECERLQGFPDDFTLIRFNGKAAADGPRYRALGNAMAVPVIGWILRRIKEFSNIGRKD